MKNKVVITVSLSIIACSLAHIAEAQNVVAGQYVIKPAHTGIGAESIDEVQLYKTGDVGIKSIVPFSTEDTTCSDLIAKGIAAMCEPNFIYQTQATMNDPMLSQLWGMQTIQAPKAWDVTTGSRDVVVAVIDTGMDYTHPDLAANVWTNPGEIPDNGIDDDGDGYIDDVHGINAAAHTGNPMDDNGHGTHVSGTIAGVGNNGIGVVGVAPNVKVMPLKFLGAGGGGTLLDAVNAIHYMVMMKNRGVNIVAANNSWGGAGYSQFLEQAIEMARDAGILFVAAAGNEANFNDGSPTYPANYTTDNVISVAAIGQDGNLASFSNYGPLTVHIAAPGVSIISSVPNNDYRSYSGTSMATPHVTGVAALVASVMPGASYAAIKDRILSTGVVSSKLAGKVMGAKLLNAYNAVTGQINSTPDPVTPTTPASSAAKIRDLAVNGTVNTFSLRVRANAATTAGLSVKVNGKSCAQTGTFTADSLTTIKGRMTSSQVSSLTFEVKTTNSSKQKTIRKSQSSVRRSSTLSSKALKTTCSKLFSSFRVK